MPTTTRAPRLPTILSPAPTPPPAGDRGAPAPAPAWHVQRATGPTRRRLSWEWELEGPDVVLVGWCHTRLGAWWRVNRLVRWMDEPINASAG